MHSLYSEKSPTPKIRIEFVISLFLILAILYIYYQTKNFDFVLLDDDVYILNNPYVARGLSAENIKWAFFSSHGGFWIPLTWLSYMGDSHLHGLNAGYYHVTNLIFHILNTLLVFAVFRRMTGDLWRSGFVAALFAVHPVHVESVAWVSERKDLLFAFFWLLTMWCYQRYAQQPRPWRYAIVILTFIAGLMSKPMIVTLPFVLLLLDYWPLNRITLKKSQTPDVAYPTYSTVKIILEKVPLIALSLAASVFTFVLQQAHGAVSSIESSPASQRVVHVLVAYVKYIIKMLWPRDLTAVYPYSPGIPIWQIAGSCILLGFISFLAFKHLTRRPYLITGWLWFLGTLVPVIGIVKIGSHAMADRYTYVTFVGLYIMVSWGIPEIFNRFNHKRVALALAAMGVILACMILARYQTTHWINSVRLFSHAIEINPHNFLAQRNLGLALSYGGELDRAVGHFKQALSINPSSARCYNDIGTVYLVKGRYVESIGYFEKALHFKPDYPKAHNNLGLALMTQKKYAEAAIHFQAALKTNPKFKLARQNLQTVNTALVQSKESRRMPQP